MTDERLARLRATAVRRRAIFEVVLDGEVGAQIEAVEDELDRLDSSEDSERRLNSMTTSARRKELLAELESLRQAATDSTLCLVVEGLQRTTYRALIKQHPPRRDEHGKVYPSDALIGANMETLALPLARACVVGYRERPEADAPVLRFPPAGTPDTVTLEWLLGHTRTDPETKEVVEEPGFCTEGQVDRLAAVALSLCVGPDAVPLPRSRTPKSAGG